ncbi:prepilin peptidase [Lonepinella sp. BR2474]|uniref:prepilin peptidase n=1 Tax=Lonepinella sp. BR2474 TaxID=3434548 RepID=UPI003F6DF069
MIILGFCLLGGLLGVAVRHYLQNLATQIQQEIYQSYVDLFPENAPQNCPEHSRLTPIKCGGFWLYFGVGAIFFGLNGYYFPEPLQALFWGVSGTLLFLIAKIDGHYQFISVTHCQLLMALGITGAYYQFTPISLEQALQSLLVGFVAFYMIFYLARCFYQQDALGRGDYWLMGALSSFHPWQQLPYLVFVACCLGLVFAGWKWLKGAKVAYLPFAPFLVIGQVVVLMIEYFYY